MIEPTQIPRLVVEPLTVATTETQLSVVAGWHHDECRRRGIRSSLAQRIEQLRSHLTSAPIPVTLLARKGDEPLGCVSLVRYQASVGGGRRLWLSSLYVTESMRGRGLGSLLADRACRYAREQGETELWLFTDNRQVFYKKRGWQLGGEARVSRSDVEILVRRL